MATEQSAIRSTMQTNAEGLAKAAEKQAQGAMAIQQELWSLIEEGRQDWLKLAEREAQLVSELTATLSTCKTIPEVAKAYQDWMSESLTMLGQESQRMFVDGQKLGQKFMTSAMTMIGNGARQTRV